jgi:hypothetical protein
MPPYPQFWGRIEILAPLPPILGENKKFNVSMPLSSTPNFGGGRDLKAKEILFF